MRGRFIRVFLRIVLLVGMTGWPGFAVPGVPAPSMVLDESEAEGYALHFPSETGYLYTIEYRDGLGADTPWQEMDDFREVAGTGDILTHTDTETAGTNVQLRYYRVRIDPDSSPPTGESAVLVLYEFTGSNASPQVVHTNVTATDFDISSGSIIYGSFNEDSWTGSGVPYAQGNQGWVATNAVEAKHFNFTVAVQDESVFSVTNIRFLARSTGNGPSVMSVLINESIVYEQNLPDSQTMDIVVPVTDLEDQTQAVVRIAGWDNETRDTSGGGQFRIDDVRLEGFIGAPPEPETPTVVSPVYTNVSDTTATLGGTIADDGFATVTERGIFWSTTPGFSAPNQGTRVSANGQFGSGAFTVAVSELPADTDIYFRAFATNEVGMGLTDEALFTTERLPVLQPPALTNPAAMNVTETTALLGGTVTNDGGGIIVERGVYWSESPGFNPPEEGNKVHEDGEYEPEAFMVQAQNLPGDTEIFMRAFASNAEQTGFSELYSFTTPADDDLAFYSFTGETTEPESHRETINAAAITISDGNILFQSPGPGQASEWEALGGANPQLAARGGWAATNQSEAKHFQVSLSTESGWFMTITNIRYLARSTAQGPSGVGITLNGDALYEIDGPANDVILVQSAVSNHTDLTEAVIRIEGWDNGSRDTTGGGELQIDSVLVQGFMSMHIEVDPPDVVSPTVTNISATAATLGGDVIDDGGATIKERGIHWSTVDGFPLGGGTKVSQSGSFGTGVFAVAVAQLPSDTEIYFRAFASSAGETAYSDQASFTTPELEAALLSLYEFTDSEITPQARHPYVTSSHLVHNTGRPGIGSLNESLWTGSGVPYAQAAGNLAETDVAHARHFIYAIEARTGTTFDITNITFLARSTAAGPSALSVSIDGNVIHTQDMPNGDVISVNLPVTGVTGRTLSRIRILGWDNGSRDTAGTGLMQIDDVRTEGAVAGSITPPVTDGRPVRVASYNIENGIGEVDGDKYDALKTTLERLDADIVAFQELFATQSNEWVALAADLGYEYTTLAPEAGQRTGYYSRFPIQSTHAVQSPANEMTRPVWRAVIDVPDAELPLIIWNAHKKALGDEVSQFRRAVETIRIIEDIDAYHAANTAHVEYIVLGDMNADFFTQPQSSSFSETWFNDNQGAFPSSYELGEDIEFPVLYARFPDDRYAAATDHGFYRPVITQADGNGIFSFEDNNFISRLDYMYVSDALAVKVPAGEIYHSKHDGAFPGLPKAGDPLPADTSWTASDHLPIFVDIYMSDGTTSEFAETSERSVGETSTQDEEGTLSLSLSVTSEDSSLIEEDDADSRTAPPLRTLAEVAEVTRLEITPLPDETVELRFPSDIGFLYTVESAHAFDGAPAWEIVKDYERIPGTGDPISRVDDRPLTDGKMRFYRVRVREAP